MWICQGILDRQFHIRRSKLRHYRSIFKFHHRVYHTLWLQNDLYTIKIHIKQMTGFDHFQTLIDHRCRIYRNLASHAPVRTNLTVTANLHMRAIGYKPFVAPAFSSGAISILMTLRKQWHCGSVFLGGVYMGVKNRYTDHGIETEALALPEKLYERIEFAAENLAKIV